MAQSIKISDEDMAILRAEAELTSRSVAGQAEHWMRIGRAIEKSSVFNYERVKNALRGLDSLDNLNGDEQELFLDLFADVAEQPTPEQVEFFTRRKQQGLGVGLDEEGNLVKQQPEQ